MEQILKEEGLGERKKKKKQINVYMFIYFSKSSSKRIKNRQGRKWIKNRTNLEEEGIEERKKKKKNYE